MSLKDPRNYFRLPTDPSFTYSIFDLFDDSYARGLRRHLSSYFAKAAYNRRNCFRLRDFSGEHHYVECLVDISHNTSGPTLIRGTSRLLSEIVDETLARYAGRFRNGGRIAGWDRDTASNDFHVSRQWRHALGLADNVHVAFSDFKERSHPEDLPRVEAAIRANELYGSYSIEYRIRRDGPMASDTPASYVWQRAIGSRFTYPLSKKTFVSGVNVDIDSERQSQLLLRSIVDADPHFIFIKDPEGRFVFVNKALADFYGIDDARDAEGRNDEWFYMGDERLEIRTQLQGFRNADYAALNSAVPLHCIYERIVPPHGEVEAAMWLATVKRKILYQGTYHVLGISTDISMLAFEKETLEALVRNSPAVMYVKDSNGIYKKVNQAFLDVVSAKRHQDVVGKRAVDFFDDESATEIDEYDRHVLATGSVKLHEHEVTLKDGSRRLFRGSKVRRSSVTEGGHRIQQLLGIYYDISGTAEHERFVMLRSLLQCIDHDYANLFFKHVLSQLDASAPSDLLVARRNTLALMIEMASGYLSRLRWLEGVAAEPEKKPSLMRNGGMCTLESCVSEVDMILSLCGIKAPPAGY